MNNYQIFPAEKLGQIAPNTGLILDVRTPMEHAEKHLAFGHALAPLDSLDPTDLMMRHGLDKDAGVYILCRSGKRAAQAAEKFIHEGYHSVYVVEGGLLACEECGHDMKGHAATGGTPKTNLKRPLPLERQVRIAAGLITAIGALLALTLSPLFSLIPLFVGSGLVFAGITDRCGMALILTKAPWNKIDNEPQSIKHKT